MKTINLDFDTSKPVWFMYNNKVVSAKIHEVRFKEFEMSYWFWWKDVVSDRNNFDENIHTENTFVMSVDNLFETKKQLLNSL